MIRWFIPVISFFVGASFGMMIMCLMVVSGRADEVLESGLTYSLANTTTRLDKPVGVELLGGSADTHHQCGSKNKYSFFHKYKFISNQYLKSATRNAC